MSKLTAGETPVTLVKLNGEGDETLILKPNERAFMTISRQFGGLANARRELVAENAEAALFILRQGLNWDEVRAKTLQRRVFLNGLSADLLVALIKYVAIVGNGGKPLPDDLDDDSPSDGAQDEGNE